MPEKEKISSYTSCLRPGKDSTDAAAAKAAAKAGKTCDDVKLFSLIRGKSVEKR